MWSAPAAPQLLQQRDQHRVGGDLDLLAQPLKQMRAPLGEIGDARREPGRVQAQPQHVDGRLEQRGIGAGEQRRHRRVRVDQRPVPVDRERRIRLVAFEHELDRLARRRSAGSPIGRSANTGA